MSLDGAFNPLAREIIYEAAGQRCIGCGRNDITCQHRRARGMGGTAREAAISIGHPANGLALCGSGTTGCHGWVESHPTYGALLGWRLAPGEHALTAPFYQRVWGWRCWVQEDDGFISVAYVHADDLPNLADREAALAAFEADLAIRKTYWGKTK